MSWAARILIPLLLGLVGLGTVIGIRPLLAPDGLTALYGTDLAALDDMTLALLQHRAVMVAVIGLLLWLTIVRREMIVWLVPLVMLSKASFLAILWPVRGDAMVPIVFDAVSIAVLGAVIILHVTSVRTPA